MSTPAARRRAGYARARCAVYSAAAEGAGRGTRYSEGYSEGIEGRTAGFGSVPSGALRAVLNSAYRGTRFLYHRDLKLNDSTLQYPEEPKPSTLQYPEEPKPGTLPYPDIYIYMYVCI